jgi:hypothetical protein
MLLGCIVDITTVEKIRARIMPGSGNLPDGSPRLEGTMWIVPFRNHRGGALQAFILDRPIQADLDLEKAVQDLEQSVGLAIGNCI